MAPGLRQGSWNRCESLFRKVAIESECSIDLPSTHHLKTDAVDETQLSAIRCQPVCDRCAMDLRPHPFDLDPGQQVFRKGASRGHAKATWNQRGHFDENEARGRQRFVRLDELPPNDIRRGVVQIVGVEHGEECGGIEKDSHSPKASAR